MLLFLSLLCSAKVSPSTNCSEVYLSRNMFLQTQYLTTYGPLGCDVEGRPTSSTHVTHLAHMSLIQHTCHSQAEPLSQFHIIIQGNH